MNFPEKIRKIQNNAKGLSPVVASIILIAVTVAVSIAVAAWMGGLTGGFMQTEQVTITNVVWNAPVGTADGTATVSVRNTGSSDVVISSVTVNGVAADLADAPVSVAKNTPVDLTVTIDWTSGNSYMIKLVTAKGNSFQYSAVAAP